MPSQDSFLGHIVSHYRIVEKLGGGGMSDLFSFGSMLGTVAYMKDRGPVFRAKSSSGICSGQVAETTARRRTSSSAESQRTRALFSCRCLIARRKADFLVLRFIFASDE